MIYKNYVIYFGINSLFGNKRGVENVILTQIQSIPDENIIYIHLGKFNSVYRNGSKNIISISIKNNFFFWITLNLLIKKINNIKFIHSHSYLLSFFLIRKTNIFTVHDGLYYQYKSFRSFKKILFYFLELITYYKCEHVTFISKFSKINSLFKNNTTYTIIPNTSHLEKIKTTLKFSTKFVLPFKEYILVVKNFDERANYDLLLKVAKNSKHNFVFVGSGPLFDKIKEKSMNLKNIFFTGYVNDNELCFFYSNSKFTINSALYGEGFGLPIIESYLFNKPCFASNICAIPEVIIENKHLFENNVDSLSSLLKISDNLINEINYSEYYNKNFSNSVVIEMYKKLYTN